MQTLAQVTMYRRRADAAFYWGGLLVLLALAVLLGALPAFAQVAPDSAAAAPPSGSIGAQALQAFLQYVVPTLVTTLAALAVYALKKLSEFLHAKTQGSKAATALVTGTDFIGTAVSHVISGLAPDVKAALANDGQIDPVERTALKDKALALIKAELPDGIKAVLGGVMQGGLETWLSGKAEQAITAAAAQASPAAAPSPQ